jgi:hypothetical protein
MTEGAGRRMRAGLDFMNNAELTLVMLIPTLTTPEDGDNNATINLKRL